MRVSLPMMKHTGKIDESEVALGKRSELTQPLPSSVPSKSKGLLKTSVDHRISDKKVLDGLYKAMERCSSDAFDQSTALLSTNTVEEADSNIECQDFEILSSAST